MAFAPFSPTAPGWHISLTTGGSFSQGALLWVDRQSFFPFKAFLYDIIW
jgi:hypothetical protein